MTGYAANRGGILSDPDAAGGVSCGSVASGGRLPCSRHAAQAEHGRRPPCTGAGRPFIGLTARPYLFSGQEIGLQ
jgi:hypothetical protein